MLIEIDYPLLGSAINSLKYKNLSSFFSVYDYIQSKWENLCDVDKWTLFKNNLNNLTKWLNEKKISYKEFRNEFSTYIEKVTHKDQIDKVISLVRESYNCNDENELRIIGIKIFNLK